MFLPSTVQHKCLFSGGCFAVVLFVGMSPATAADVVASPNPEQRLAVAQLVNAGASIVVHADFEVRSVSFSSRTNQPVTDETLALLKSFPRLESISLFSPNVTDAGLSHLVGLKNLRSISLINTKVTDAGVKSLRESLPECRVNTAPFGGFTGGPTAFGPSPLLALLQSPATQTQLKLTDEQKRLVGEIVGANSSEAFRTRLTDLFSKLREAKTDEERESGRNEVSEKLASQRKEVEDAIKKVLSEEQFGQLQQLPPLGRRDSADSRSRSTTFGGFSPPLASVLRSPSIQTQLSLTDEQKQAVATLLERDSGQRRELTEQSNKQQQAIDAEIQKILSPEQYQRLQRSRGGRSQADAARTSDETAKDSPAPKSP